MISIADEVYLLADYGKFGQQSFALVSRWDQIHHLITDGRSGAEAIKQLRERSVDVIQLKD
jgi:DeoR family transcriptional regulator, L-fucose operon activator